MRSNAVAVPFCFFYLDAGTNGDDCVYARANFCQSSLDPLCTESPSLPH